MHYEINISKNGQHLFATHERSITDIVKCRQVHLLLIQHFPKTKGYSIRVTRYESIGEIVNIAGWAEE